MTELLHKLLELLISSVIANVPYEQCLQLLLIIRPLSSGSLSILLLFFLLLLSFFLSILLLLVFLLLLFLFLFSHLPEFLGHDSILPCQMSVLHDVLDLRLVTPLRQTEFHCECSALEFLPIHALHGFLSNFLAFILYEGKATIEIVGLIEGD